MKPTFSLAYTSVRAGLIPQAVDLWRTSASGQHPIEVVIAVDAGNSACLAAAQSVPEAKVVIQESAPFDCVKGWNLAAANTTGQILIGIADDFRPPVDWDTKLYTLRDHWAEEDWIAHTEDGYVHDIAVLAILTRKRYERFGYLFYPGYQSVFCDTEFTACAQAEGRVLDARHIFIEHLHPDAHKRERDEHDDRHASEERWKLGHMLFEYRRHRGFPIDDGPRAQTGGSVKEQPFMASEESPTRFALYMQVNRDDLCLAEVCDRFMDEGIRDFFFAIPDEYWSGQPTRAEHKEEVWGNARRLAACGRGVRVNSKMFTISDYRFPGDSRITVETRARNDALAWVRQHGFSHILVADSDELWPVGSVAKLQEIVNNYKPSAVSLPMLPVAGFPGYPIEGAEDRALGYVGGSCVFKDCRTPVGLPPYFDNSFRVIHFTSTRKTMAETIEKHRQSGHFDDPLYDFEFWIEHVLPHIRPGFQPAWPDGRRGIHMFRTYQIWPSIRDWTTGELDQIPKTIWPYLGLPKTAK
jgi:hypothetical protein